MKVKKIATVSRDELIEALHTFDNKCLDEGYKFYDVTTLFEANEATFSMQDKVDLKNAVTSDAPADMVGEYVQNKVIENDPIKGKQLAKLKEDTSDDDDYVKCAWCDEEFPEGELRETDLGLLCDQCISAIKSHGEDLWIKA